MAAQEAPVQPPSTVEPSSTQNAATLPELPATGSAPPLLGSVHPCRYEPRLPSRPSHASCTAAEEQRLVQFVRYQDFGVMYASDIRADECAVGIAQMTVKEGRQLSIVAEADELDSSNGSTEQHVSTVLDAEHGSKSWTPNLIDVERENRGWVRRHRHGWGGRVGGSAGDALSQLACVWGSVQV